MRRWPAPVVERQCLALTDSKYLKQYLAGKVGGVHFTQGFLLGSAVLMEIPIAMVLLSRRLNYRTNRTTNIVAGTNMTLVQVSTLFVGSATAYHAFFSVIEIACTSLIVWQAWKWTNPDGQQRIDGTV